ncbi:MAG: type II toxin-antitoxin system VapC family toxin [Oceanipulchritudo sp.]
MAGECIYLDTSAVLAYLDADDECHAAAVAAWNRILDEGSFLVMTEWVRLECWSLVQRRLGMEAVKDFHGRILPCCRVDPVDENRFEQLAGQVLVSRRRDLSLVDLSSFDSMNRNAITHALAFDRHFNEQGFVTPDSPDW